MEGLQQFTEELRQFRQVMEQYIRVEREKRNPWCDPEEAATILGINLTSSRKHRRKLNAMIDRGLITKFRDPKTPKFWRKEIEHLAARMAEGKVSY